MILNIDYYFKSNKRSLPGTREFEHTQSGREHRHARGDDLARVAHETHTSFVEQARSLSNQIQLTHVCFLFLFFLLLKQKQKFKEKRL